MNRLNRLTTILIQLQSKRVVKAQEIAERFDISLRTVYRDIRTLEEAGVPISSEAGIGYFLVEGYHLPPVHFTQEEANALLLGAKLIEPFSDASIKKEYRGALTKIQSVLKLIQKDELEQLEQQMRVFHPTQIPNSNTHHLVSLQSAIATRQVLRLHYAANYQNTETEREVEPIGLNFYSGNWHLIAWCRLREDYRDFRVDRIIHAEPKRETFKLNGHMGLDEYIEKVANNYDRYKVLIKVKKSLYPYLVNHKHTLGFVKDKELDDHIMAEFLVSSLEYFGRNMLMYEDYIEILEPVLLKEKMKEMVKKLAQNYLDE